MATHTQKLAAYRRTEDALWRYRESLRVVDREIARFTKMEARLRKRIAKAEAKLKSYGLLTPNAITEEALALLHQKLNGQSDLATELTMRVNDFSAKVIEPAILAIGETLRVRMPVSYAVRPGEPQT